MSRVVHPWWLLVIGLQACKSTPPELKTRLIGMKDLRDEAIANHQIAGIPVSDWVTLRGMPIPMLSPPFANAPAFQVADRDGLNVLPAFSEGKTAAFVVAEVWQDIPQNWIQPWYVLVTRYNAATPNTARLPGSRAIIDIDVTSWFYSPFWELVWAVVPPDTPPDKYTSASQLFQDNLEMHRNGLVLAPVSPDDLRISVTSASGPALRPFSNDTVGSAPLSMIYLKGALVPSLIFPTASFTWDAAGAVDEVPLFVFSRTDDAGNVVSLRLPSVIGTGPLGSTRPARVTLQGVPQYGSFTRIYQTLLPPTAGVFIPHSLGALRDYYRSLGVQVRDIDPAVEARDEAKDYILRVAVNPDCFSTSFPGCRWLDSQSAIEANVSQANIIRQKILLTSPVVFLKREQR